MSTVDLSTLPAPQVLESLDYEALYEEGLAAFREYMGNNWSAALESDPVVKLIELGAYCKMQNRARVNDAAKALMLAYAEKEDLDQLAANVRLQRLVIQPANLLTVPPVEEVKESDDALRERIQLVYEGLSTAGPSNSYIFHARAASALVADATVVSPSPAVVVVTVLSLAGSGLADQSLLDAVYTNLSEEDTRPLTDHVLVQSAEILNYRIDAVLHMIGAGPENDAILAEAVRRLAAWINPRKRLALEVARSAIDAQLHISGVGRVELLNWVDLKPTKAQAAYCTGFSVVLGGST